MEQHTENSGRLRGKFDDFTHTPKDEVWDRIAADASSSNERSLGASFRAFAYAPHRRVWRRISAQLHPQRTRVVAFWWSAAAGVALLVGLGLAFAGGSGSATQSSKAFALKGKVNQLDWNSAQRNGGIHAPQQGSQFADISENPVNLAANGGSKHDAQFLEPVIVTHEKLTILPLKFPMQFWPDALAARNILRTGKTHEEALRIAEFRRAIAAEKVRMEQDALIAQFPDLPKEDERQGWEARLGSNLSQNFTGHLKSVSADGTENAATVNDPNDPNGFGGFTGIPQSLTNASADAVLATGEDFQTPLVLGVTVKHPIAKRFSLGGGLIYTRMASTYSVNAAGQLEKYSVTRQYLGPAANVYYDFVQKKRLSLYATTGIQLDFGLPKQNNVTIFPVDGSGEHKNITQSTSGSQLNVNTGLGANFMLTRHIGIYGQGSAALYPLQTRYNLWSEKRVWPTLQGGLRIVL